MSALSVPAGGRLLSSGSSPSIDILLPVRNGSAVLGEALSSVESQDYVNWRCLILDDGSTDDSARLAEEFARRDRRFELLRWPARGLVATLNEGLRIAKAPLVARLDSDDRMAPTRLSEQVAVLEREKATVVGTGVRFFGRPITQELRRYESWLNAAVEHDEIVRELWIEAALAHPSVLARREPILEVGGYRDLAYPEDYDLWLRGLRAGWRFAKARSILTFLRDHDDRLTRTHPRYTRRAFLDCKAEHLVAHRSLAGKEVVVWGAGRDGRRIAKAMKRQGALLAAFIDIAETKVGRQMLGVRVESPDWLERGLEGRLILACVGIDEARERIRRYLGEQGLQEGGDFVCLA